MSLKHRHVTKKSSSSSLSSSSSRDSVKQNHVSYDDVIKGLEKEMGSMRGRDADIVGFFFFRGIVVPYLEHNNNNNNTSQVIRECDELMETLKNDQTVSKKSKKKFLTKLKDVRAEASAESEMEKGCAKWIPRIIMFTTIGPAILTMLGMIQEFAMRPNLELESGVDLSGTINVITGGCSGLGIEVSKMYASRGGSVIVGCRGDENRLSETLSVLSEHGVGDHVGHNENDDDDEWFEEDEPPPPQQQQQFFKAYPLDLESFESVELFTKQIITKFGNLGIDTIIHNAAANETCRDTQDGFEVALQVNYLSPFLLNLRLDSLLDSKSGRVVHVTCDSALVQEDWLPWPFRRVHPSLLPSLKRVLSSQRSDRCDPSLSFANSKLATLCHSKELDRRFSGSSSSAGIGTQRRLKRLPIRRTSNAVNPGPTASGRMFVCVCVSCLCSPYLFITFTHRYESYSCCTGW